jgi:hypothetical protein
VQPGDRVVAQDVATGELALKPVIERTLRPTARMISMEVGDKTIVSTLGHPYWVNSHGWRMARDIEAGEFVHTLKGAVEIRQTKRLTEEEPAYNLVVQDFGTYFVTDQAVLVHDNTSRTAARATVPGLIEEDESITGLGKEQGDSSLRSE